jgi:protein-disulfide isomerase
MSAFIYGKAYFTFYFFARTMSTPEKNTCCEGEIGGGKGLTALLIIIATIANIGASYLFSTQVIEASKKAEYDKVGGKENYELLNKIQLEQIKPFLEQYKAKNGGAKATDTAGAKDTPATQPEVKTEVKKSDRPVVDLFVMSYCPFGLQAEKAFVPLIDKFKKYADINVKFVQYTMHGLKEGQENTRQYCIREEQADKFVPYVSCFVKAEGQSDACLKEAKVDTKKLEKCYTSAFEKFGGEAKLGATGNPEFPADKEVALAAGVQGSPTLVINGAQVEANRTQAGYAKAICDSFTDGKKPAVCDEKFSKDAYQPGFGTSTGGSGAPAAGCATN